MSLLCDAARGIPLAFVLKKKIRQPLGRGQVFNLFGDAE